MMNPTVQAYFNQLVLTHSREITYWKNTIIEALPQSNILQAIYQKWSALPEEVRIKAALAGYMALSDPGIRAQMNYHQEKYLRYAVIFAHVFDCWSIMQETFGACGFHKDLVDWTVSLQEDVLFTMERLEETILVAQVEYDLLNMPGNGRKRRSPSPIISGNDGGNPEPKKNCPPRMTSTEFFNMEAAMYGDACDPGTWSRVAREIFPVPDVAPDSRRSSGSGDSMLVSWDASFGEGNGEDPFNSQMPDLGDLDIDFAELPANLPGEFGNEPYEKGH